LSKNLDDQLYVLLHKNFKRFGLLRRKQRQFEQPKLGFKGREHGVMFPNYKQRNLKKRMGKKEYSKRDRKGFRIL
jgi:hypothetical protein